LTGNFSPRVSNYRYSTGAWYCDYNANRTVTTDKKVFSPVINGSGYSNMQASFNYIMGGDASNYFYFGYSLDGSTFVPIGSPYYGVSTKTLATVTLPSACNGVNFYLGFEFVCGASTTISPTFSFDDVSVAAPTPVSFSWTSSSTPAFSSSSQNTTDTHTVNGETYTMTATNSYGCPASATTSAITVTHVDAPTGSDHQSFCASVNPTVAYLIANGTVIKWYEASTGGSPISTGQALVDGHHYYARQTPGSCESATRLDVLVSLVASPAIVTVASSGTYCGSTVLTASSAGTGSTIYFQGPTSGNTSTGAPSFVETVTTSGTYYFRARTNDALGCWGPEGSATVIINPLPNPVTVSVFSSGLNCGTATLHATTNGSPGNSGTIYFQGTTSGGTSTANPGASHVVNADGTYYFRARSTAGCWGQEGSYTVTIVPVPNAPTGNPIQYFCPGFSVSNIAVTGTSIIWYADGTTTAPLDPGTGLVDGVHYFATQTINGCESPRWEVEIHIAIPQAPTGPTTQWFCATDNPTVGQLTANGEAIQWYADASGGDPLSLSTPLVNGIHYYATQFMYGCQSTDRYDVIAVLNNVVPIDPITGGSSAICVNTTSVAFADATPNGVWSITNGSGSASINNAGVVTGLSGGTVTVNYTVTVGSCTSSVTTTLLIHSLPTVAPITGTFGICVGSTSQLADATNGGSWAGNNTNTAVISTYGLVNAIAVGTTSVTYTVTDGNSCVNHATQEISVYPTYSFTENAGICKNGTLLWHGQSLSSAGTYNAHYTSIHGCDSNFNVNLTVYPFYTFTEAHSICEGATYNWHNQNLTTAGSYTAAYTTIHGCDSIYYLTLTVNPKYAIDESQTICQGEPFTWHGLSPTATGVYTKTYQTHLGCDSIYTLTLTVNPVATHTETHTICQGETYTWHNQSLTIGGPYTAQELNAYNCYDTYNLTLTVNPVATHTETHTICQGETYQWHGQNLTIAGPYTAQELNTYNCYDTYNLTLTVNPVTTHTETHTICQGDVYVWHAQDLTVAGPFTAQELNSYGCYDTYNLTLTVNTVTTHTETHTICQGETYQWHGQNLTDAGPYTAQELNAYNCYDIYNLTLTVNPVTTHTETHTICQGETYDWHGQSLTDPGPYTAQVLNAYNCYDTYNLTLTVNPANTYTDNQTINEGDTYVWRGQNLTTAGTYTDYALNSYGCTDTYILNLTVNPLTKTLTVKAFLEGLYIGSGTMKQAQDVGGARWLPGVSDVVTIELHDATSPYAVAYTFGNLDISTGGIVTTNTIPATITGSYYLVIKHRNSIATWSADPIDFSSSAIDYDFSTSASTAYGSNLKTEGGGVYAIYAGDANQDGIVDGSDMAAIDNASTAVMVGYHTEDLNGDGIVDASDMAIIDNNSTAVISTRKP